MTMATQKTRNTLIFRISEVLLGLALLTWYALHITGGCLRDLLTLLLRPLSVFLISNAIIVTVAVLSGEAESDTSNVSCRSHHTAETSTEKAVSDEVITLSCRPLKDDPEEEVDGGGQQHGDSTAATIRDKGKRETAVQDGAGEEEGETVVEDLSEEEFNRTVEKYIALTRSFLHKERLDAPTLNAN